MFMPHTYAVTATAVRDRIVVMNALMFLCPARKINDVRQMNSIASHFIIEAPLRIDEVLSASILNIGSPWTSTGDPPL